ncbi:hypothetical protein JCM19992_27050 [Thermostilla marina]
MSVGAILTAVAASPAPAQSPACSHALSKYEFRGIEMAVPVRIVCYAASEDQARQAARAAFTRIRELNDVFSDYLPDSEVSRLCATAGSGEAVPVSDDLWHVLVLSRDLAEKTGGAFDVTIGPLIQLWRRARTLRELPREYRIREARAAVGFDKVRFDEQHQAVELTVAGMKLDFGGIAKGYAIDQALAVLRQHGISRALVDAGGDIGVGDPPPGRDAWVVGIAPLNPGEPPGYFVKAAHCAVATSGDRYQFVMVDGKRYSHIVDPRTGVGLTQHSEVTVIAPNATLADALATGVSVLGPEKGLTTAERFPEVACLVLQGQEDEVVAYPSPRWKQWTAQGRIVERLRSAE